MSLESALNDVGELVLNNAIALVPIQTGNLMRSLGYKVIGDEVHIGTDVEYAPYVEYGTWKQEAQPYLVPSVESNKEEIIDIIVRGILND